MTTRTQVFKDSWAHIGKWPAAYSYPRCTGGQSPYSVCRRADDAVRVHAAYWQEVADELRDGLIFGLRCV